jgi:hypothetical protein
MRLSPYGGVTPASRGRRDLAAMHAAYRHGLYFDIDIPLIDEGDYLERERNMHKGHQSFC